MIEIKKSQNDKQHVLSLCVTYDIKFHCERMLKSVRETMQYEYWSKE